MNFNRKKYIKAVKKTAVITIATAMLFTAYGCNSSDNSSKNSTEATTASASGNSTGSISVSVEDMFSDRDMEIGYDEQSAINIKLENSSVSCDDSGVTIDGTVITINKEGVYVLSGTLSEGQIIVDAGDSDKVQLVLKNVDITCKSSAAIYVKNADKVFITTAKDSENTLKTTGEFVNIDDNNIDGVIFAKADITLNGAGTLNIDCSSAHGIVCKDDLKLTSGAYNINAASHALSGKDSVRIAGGTYNLTSKTASIHSENTDNTEKGFIYIADGEFTISSEKDGIKASSSLTINGGNINITKSEEGLEAMHIDINGGNISIVSNDDGINASGGNSDSNRMQGDSSLYIKITGGTVNVVARGDGVDSNGNIYITGGALYVTGPESNGDGALDYENEAVITGGTVVAAGYSGMAVNFSSSSTQGSMLVNITNTVSGEVTLKDESGETLVSYTPQKSYNSVVISTPKIELSKTYTVSMAGTETSVTMDSLIYGEGMSMGGGEMGRPEEGNRPNGMGRPEDGEMPSGMEMPEDGERPSGMERPEKGEKPSGNPQELPDNGESPSEM